MRRLRDRLAWTWLSRAANVSAAAIALFMFLACACDTASAQLLDFSQGESAGQGRSGAMVDRSPRPLGAAPKNGNAESGATTGQQSPLAGAWGSLNPTLRTGISLAIVLVMIVLLSAGAKRAIRRSGVLAGAIGAASAPAGVLEVLGRYPVARGQTIILLKIERRILMLSQTAGRLRTGGGGLSLLAEINDPEDVASILMKVQEASGTSSGERFKSLLNAFGESHGDGVHEVTGDGSADWLVEDDSGVSGAESGGLRLSELEETSRSGRHAGLRLRGAL